MTKHTPTPWHTSEDTKKSDMPRAANKRRAVACVNAFHSSDGREIKTEKIEAGVFWTMLALLKSEFLNESLGYLEDTASEEVWAKARLFMEDRDALLAKLEE